MSTTSGVSDLRDRLRSAELPGPDGVSYRVLDLHGEGGQGWVFKARSIRDGSADRAQSMAAAPDVVVKVLRPDASLPEKLARFEREAEVLRSLSSGPSAHPNIVRFHHFGRHTLGDAPITYLVMEHVDGSSLSKVLAAHGGFGLPVMRVLRIFRQIADALATVHRHRLVHRDLKPSNVLLANEQGQEIAKVTDFGLVKVPDAAVNRTVTVAGATTGYAPPEQYEVGNRRVGPQTDVFAFAAMLFEALSGCEAFPVAATDTALRVVARMLSGDRPELARVTATVCRELRDRQDLAAILDREIARATDGDPGNRHDDVAAFWGAVEGVLLEVAGGSAQTIAAGRRSAAPSLRPEGGASGDRISGQIAAASVPSPSIPVASVDPRSGVLPARMVGPAMTGERLRAAVISEDGRSVVGVGAFGLYRFSNGVWSAKRAPRGVDARGLRGAVQAWDGDLLVFGEGGAAIRIRMDGSTEPLEPFDDDAVWLGGIADATGVVLVGERRSRPVGVWMNAPEGKSRQIVEVDGATRLCGVARLKDGSTLVCGTHGALFMAHDGDVDEIVWGRTGHLLTAAGMPDGGAVVVGSGGHALSIAPPHHKLPGVAPAATLEAVQTTRDLVAVTVDVDGVAWAVGGQARVLHRSGGTWLRLPLDPSISASWIAVGARPRKEQTHLTLVGDDGVVWEVTAPRNDIAI